MRSKCSEQAILDQSKCILHTVICLVKYLLPKDNLFKNIFDYTIAGELDYVAAVGRLPALHFSL